MRALDVLLAGVILVSLIFFMSQYENNKHEAKIWNVDYKASYEACTRELYKLQTVCK